MDTFEEISKELARARSKHPTPQHSKHEGIAILEEEFLEAREAVFEDHAREQVGLELIQVAAMAIRMIEDLKLLETR